MNSIFNPTQRNALIARIQHLTPENVRQWGSMSVHQMLCHAADQLRYATGERTEIVPKKTGMPLWLLKIFVFNLPWPKNSPTMPEFKQGEAGTPCTTFEGDRAELLRLLNKAAAADFQFPPHPAFGVLSRKQWDKLIVKHLNWHLKQFSA